MSPLWFRLIAHQQRRHKLALTIPFLIGAARQPIGSKFESEALALDAVRDLLRNLEDEAPGTHTVSITVCPTLLQPVVSTMATHYHAAHAKWGVKDPATTSRLRVATPYRTPDQANAEYTVDTLWSQLRVPLTEGLFLFYDKAYHAFGTEDEKFIADALAYDQDNEL